MGRTGARDMASSSAISAAKAASLAEAALPRPACCPATVLLQSLDGPVPDPPGRNIDNPKQTNRILGVHQYPQISQHVLDLLAVVELDPAGDLVGDTRRPECLLQHPAEGVDAVENRHLAIRRALAIQLGQDGRHFACLQVLVLKADDLDLRAAFPRGLEALVLSLAVVGDQAVGRGQDGGRGAVVGLQPDDQRVGIVRLELHDVLYVRSAPGIDALVRVAGGADVLVLQGDAVGNVILGVVGVLVLVDEYVLESLGERLADLGLVAHQQGEPHQQVVEVQGVVGREDSLVDRVDLGDVLGEVVAGGRGDLGRPMQGVLGPGYAAKDGPRGKVRDVQLELDHRLLDAAELIGLIVDAVGAGQAGLVAELPQKPGAQTVERCDGRAAAHAQGLDALGHLPGRFVGEGDRQDRPGGNALADHVGHAARDDARLAGAGASQHQHRPVHVRNGPALWFVQVGKQVQSQFYLRCEADTISRRRVRDKSHPPRPPKAARLRPGGGSSRRPPRRQTFAAIGPNRRLSQPLLKLRRRFPMILLQGH